MNWTEFLKGALKNAIDISARPFVHMRSTKHITQTRRCELLLESDVVKATFLPHDGGRLISLVYKPSGREFIWTNPRTSRLIRYFGANYDNLSAGGIEEAFPSGYADALDGDEIPFFGEVWATEWQYRESYSGGWMMEALCSVYPVCIRKEWILLHDRLECSYEIENFSEKTLPYLFGVHPSMRIGSGDKIRLPNGLYETGAMFPQDLTEQELFHWPMIGKRDLRFLPQENACELLQIFTKNAEEGALALESMGSNACLVIEYDPSFFKSLSVWMLYGGWRGYRCIMSEFFNGWPLRLSQAVAENNCFYLPARGTVRTTVSYQLQSI